MLTMQKRANFLVASEVPWQHLYPHMTNSQMKCQKCEGNMVQGFVPDRTYGGILVEGWYRGQPKKSFWRHTKAPRNQSVPIGAFRCQGCGYLEFYADPKFAAQ